MSDKVTLLYIIILLISIGQETNAQPVINPCAQASELHIVILGSSTAAGTGPSAPDSTWVNKYRKYLQEINPQNQVTNLAIGGTTTYHIMPDWFIAPPGRPVTNPNNNVTQAITLGADAIIVNMPSNDAANGFDLNEQMTNFITIFNSADSAGIPVWTCTPQPRNFGATAINTQLDVRDSVLSYFGTMAVDFWNGIADTTNTIDPAFDSGDGVHLNDAGHAILVSRIINKAIPNLISDTLQYTDHAIIDFFIDNLSVCGDSINTLNVVVVNKGIASPYAADVNIEIVDNLNLTTFDTLIISPSLMNGCDIDTLTFGLNTYEGVNLTIRSFLVTMDSISTNDTSQVMNITTTGHPEISTINDTVCINQSVTLVANYSNSNDTIIWYDDPVAGNIISTGSNLILNNLTNTQTYYAQSVRGDLHFKNSLATTTNTTTNFNGIMFDIVAHDSITIDSIALKINSTGPQSVVGHYKVGSYVGYETNTIAWNNWDTLNTIVGTAGDFIYLNFPDLLITDGDTMGIYLYMLDAGSNLSYQAVSNNTIYSNNQLTVNSGSGISHTFGNIYFPRNFSGELFYHYGFNPEGDCHTPRIPVSAVVSTPSVFLGNDTTLTYSQSISLSAGAGFSSYLWSNNSTSSQINVDTSIFTIGLNSIWVMVTDPYGCVTTDTIEVTFTPSTGINELVRNEPKLSPNPTLGEVRIEYGEIPASKIEIYSHLGRKIAELSTKIFLYDFSDLPSGIYFLLFYFDQENVAKKLVVY